MKKYRFPVVLWVSFEAVAVILWLSPDWTEGNARKAERIMINDIKTNNLHWTYKRNDRFVLPENESFEYVLTMTKTYHIMEEE